MTFSVLRTEIGQLLNIDIADTTVLTNVKRWINTSYKNLQTKWNWSWRKREYVIQTILLYKTGSVSVVNASRTVTGSGTTWTSSMVGRYIRMDGDSDWYKIVAASATSITIENAYAGTSGSKNYRIWKRYYDLPMVIQTENDLLDIYIDNKRLGKSPYKEFPEISGGASDNGVPSLYSIRKKNTSATTYTTGTVAGTVNTRVITGTSTVWLDNVMPGDEFNDGTYTYHVESVDSDTQLTLVENILAALSTASYTITHKNVFLITLNGTPEPVVNLTITYLVPAYDLQNDADVPDMPERWHEVILDGAMAIGYRALDDTREGQTISIFEGKTNQMKQEDTESEPDHWTWYGETDE